MCGKELIQCSGCQERHWCKHYEHLKQQKRLEDTVSSLKNVITNKNRELEKAAKENQILKRLVRISIKNPADDINHIVTDILHFDTDKYLTRYIDLITKKFDKFNCILYGHIPIEIAMQFLKEARVELIQNLLKETNNESIKEL